MTEDKVREAMRGFACQYGLLGIMTALPTYHLELRERPTLVWDFHSLMTNIKLLFSLMLTDEERPLRMCKQCQRAFIAPRANSEFCSQACRNRYQKDKGKKK